MFAMLFHDIAAGESPVLTSLDHSLGFFHHFFEEDMPTRNLGWLCLQELTQALLQSSDPRALHGVQVWEQLPDLGETRETDFQ